MSALKLKFEITSLEVAVKSGNNARGPWQIREQEAHMFKGDEQYPEKVIVTLDEKSHPYAIGMYELDEKSFYVGQYKQIQCRPRLRPLNVAVAQQLKQS